MIARRYLTRGRVLALLASLALMPAGTSAQTTPRVVISEVHPSGSGNGTYAADWFEVTNVGTTAVDLTGWKVDDNSNTAANAVALRGVTTLQSGQSAVFFEGAANGSTDAAITQSFSLAWFGSPTPPVELLIGAYGGSGIGLGTGGDAVNLFDAGGTRVTGVAFGAVAAASPQRTFDNTAGAGSTTLPLPVIATQSASGVNGAALSFDAAEIGSPGRRINASPLSGVDLSTYVRVGRYDLPEPTRTTAPANNRLAQEASGVTYNWDTDTLFVVGDGSTSIVQVSKTGALIDSMTLSPGGSPQGTDFYDTEGLAYVGAGRFVMVEERDRRVVLFTYVPGATLTRADTQTVTLGTFAGNTGLEGVSAGPQTNGLIAVKEISPQGIFQTGVDFDAGTATNGSPSTVNSIDLFNPALAGLLDFADVFALSNLPSLSGAQSGHLLVLSQEAGAVVNVDRAGQIASSLTIASDPDNPLSVADQQHEGLAMDANGVLYVVSENGGGDIDHPQLWVYAPSLVPNQPPTAIALSNAVTSLPENTSTATRLRVANVALADDGLGTNQLSVSGADATVFEVDGSGLYIKAGTLLDFETKSSYGVTVAVDDTSVGSTPDATTPYTLTITDVDGEEGPVTASVAITEITPWASGNAPYAADWFEVTNTGSAPLDITGWKMDDDSSAFGSAVALTGITTIAPGESVIFMETSNLATAKAAFLTAWFGASPPAGLQVGGYSGSGVGLSTGGDAVNLFNASGTRLTGVRVDVSTSGFTFDNAAGLGSTTLPLPIIATLSLAGINGAFLAADGTETGSPGRFAGPTDVTPPVIAPVANIIVDATGPGGAVVAYTLPATQDDVDGPGLAVCAPAPGTLFAIGVTTVTCTARDTAGNSATSTFTITVRDTTVAPGAPRGLTAVVNGREVTLAWQAPASGVATGYHIVARTTGGQLLVTQPVGAVTSLTVSAPDGVYLVSVTASNAIGTGPESAAVTVTVPGAPPLPGSPTNLAASVNGDTATFTWTPPTPLGVAQGYVLAAGATPGFATPLAVLQLPSSPATTTIANIPPGTYWVRLYAANATGGSAPSNEVMVSVPVPMAPGAPTLQAATVAVNTVTLAWTPGAGGVPTSYLLGVSQTPGGVPAIIVPLTGTSTSFAGVPSGTYYLRMVALNGVGMSAVSNEIAVVVP